MQENQIRNFVIIAHIDHGKSTLADRLLEATKTIEARKMKPQLLDTMDLERERGITIKMQPVRMAYAVDGKPYTFKLIDTPGHIDFSYEVSRALAAVEGALLLVDATQGVQAQTLTNLYIAEQQGLVIIPVVNKIDSAEARREETVAEFVELLGVSPDSILQVSGKTGAGVLDLLRAIAERVPPPAKNPESDCVQFRALIFDSQYEMHRGIIAFVRVMSADVRRGDKVRLLASGAAFEVKEVGTFTPALQPAEVLRAGEGGYIVTAIKNPEDVKIGDTIAKVSELDRYSVAQLPGYKEPKPMVWASFFPEGEDQFEALLEGLGRLKLNDAALTFEVESAPIMGRSFKCGFLGMLHLEIVAERIRREFGLEVITTSPSVAYTLVYKDGREEVVSSPSKFPTRDKIAEVLEPWLKVELILPGRYLGEVLTLIDAHEGRVVATDSFGGASRLEGHASSERIRLGAEIPLREVVSDFFDSLKSVSSGYASMSYEDLGLRHAEVERMDILVADDPIPAFARILSRAKLQSAARASVAALKDILPRQLFTIKIQAMAEGRIVASEHIAALKKDVTGYLYGGDRSRKMKLWQKQKRGKERLKETGKVHIPPDVYLKMLKK